jgi:hypothetical protein
MPTYASEGILDRAAELKARADRPIDLMVVGIPDDATALERYAEAGFSRVVRVLPSVTRAPVERALDGFEAAIAEMHGH